MIDNLFEDIDQFLKTNKEDGPKLLTEDDVNTIILSLATSRGEEGFSEEEVWWCVDWVQNARLQGILAELVLQGLTAINWQGGEDGEPTFKQTELGKQAYDQHNPNI